MSENNLRTSARASELSRRSSGEISSVASGIGQVEKGMVDLAAVVARLTSEG